MTIKSKHSVCCATLFLSTAFTHLLSVSLLSLYTSSYLSSLPSPSPTPSTSFSCFIYDTSASCLEYLPRFIYEPSTQRVSLCECEMRATLFVNWQIIRTIRKKEERANHNYLSSNLIVHTPHKHLVTLI